MTHIFWVAAQILFWLVLFAVVAYGPWVAAYTFVWDHREDWFGVTVMVVAIGWAALTSIAGIVWVAGLVEEADDAAHKWRGGSGPETQCRFVWQRDTVSVKPLITKRVQYTVCD